ncbi:MAG: BlaI/MecI/CopY family transcriptional regulator [Lachnospiraceae bacterium]|nr:BlaI/MecI/CopY family transcriptional regulator [Lachnospiraceae bacterium]
MIEYRLGEVEMKFAEIIWNNEPLPSGELAKLCEKELNWKKSTTYTILKRVCERGLFRNDGGVVTSVVSKQEFLTKQSTQFVEDTFAGSLPGFVAAFTAGRRLSEAEIEELKKIIDESK